MNNKKHLYIIAGCNGAGKIIMKDKITKKESLKDKLLKGLDLAYERMIAQKRKNKQKIVVWKEGKIVTIPP